MTTKDKVRSTEEALSVVDTLKLALEALEHEAEISNDDAYRRERDVIREALAEQPAHQEPVAWHVIDPFGKIVATEKDAIRGWARIQGYKPTVESLLGFQEQGWRVVPTSPPNVPPARASKPWVGLTDEERNAIGRHHAYVDNIIRATEAKLKEKNDF